MIENNYFTDNEDLYRQFEELIDWEEIVKQYEDGFTDAQTFKKTGDEKFAFAPGNVAEAKEYYRTILDAVGDLSGHEVAPHAAELDNQGLKFKDGKVEYPELMTQIVNKFFAAGLGPIAFERKYGGLGVPNTVKALAAEMLNRADISTALQVWSTSLADIVERNASPEQKEKWIPELTAGKYFVAMGLTEPDKGSELPGVSTRAELVDGQWVLNGTKRFITIGCGMNETPSIILTLARTGGPGAKGLSFFIVKSTDITVGNIEKKLGLKCSPTCEIVFEDSPGELVGREGYGLVRYVMSMLDGARLNIAAQSTGVATAALAEARAFAAARTQFGKTLDKIPAVARMLERMERETTAMRCLAMESARSIDLYEWRQRRVAEGRELSPEENEDMKFYLKLAGLLTPLSKYYNSEMGNSLVYDGLQIHGGSGFIEEYDIARIYRDARIMTIYDGTTQIQVNAAIGGIVSGMSKTGVFRKYLEQAFKDLDLSEPLRDIFNLLEEIVSLYKSDIKGEDKDRMSFEVVQSAARLLNGLLLETTAAKLKGESREERLALAQEYHIESFTILNGNLYKLKSRNPALVAG